MLPKNPDWEAYGKRDEPFGGTEQRELQAAKGLGLGAGNVRAAMLASAGYPKFKNDHDCSPRKFGIVRGNGAAGPMDRMASMTRQCSHSKLRWGRSRLSGATIRCLSIPTV
jgi:hypothetical protein